MKNFLFLLIALFITAFSFESIAKDDDKSLKIDTENTLKGDDSKSEKFDSTTTLKGSSGTKKFEFDATNTLSGTNSKEKVVADSPEKNIKSDIPKDAKQVKALVPKIKDMAKLLVEAKKYKTASTVKLCKKIIAGLTTLTIYHEGTKEVTDKDLYKAYVACKYLKRDSARIKQTINLAKRNTPKAKKTRKFQRDAKSYLIKSKNAAKQGYKAKAEYYKTCAQIKKKVAENLKHEAASKKQLKKAKQKYNQDAAKEYAVRFRKRAKKYAEDYEEEKAEYYTKAAALKDKLANAYAKNNKLSIKALQKEYRALQKTKK